MDLYHEALANYGIRCERDLIVNDGWLRDKAMGLHAIQFHLPEDLWRVRGGRLSGLRPVVGLARFLTLAGKLGLARLWTVHDLDHHEGSDYVDRLGYQVLARCSDLLICHSDSTAMVLRRRYGQGRKIIVMPHGTYKGSYPEPRARDVVLSELGLSPDLPVAGCLGNLRPYKGIDIAASAIEVMSGALQLVVAGEPYPGFRGDEIRDRLGRIPGTVFIDRRLSASEYSDFANMCDVFWLPYHQITGSGVLLAAWSFGKGVVASDLPFFRHLIEQSREGGVVFPAGRSDELVRMTAEYLKVPEDLRKSAADRMSRLYSWDECVKPVADFLHHFHREATHGKPIH